MTKLACRDAEGKRHEIGGLPYDPALERTRGSNVDSEMNFGARAAQREPYGLPRVKRLCVFCGSHAE